MNRYDSERVRGLLLNEGWSPASSPEETDLLVINTCSVREKPLEKVFSFSGRFMKRAEEGTLLIFIMGCVAQQLGRVILERAPYISGVFGPGCEAAIPAAAAHGVFPVLRIDPSRLTEKEIFPPDYEHLWHGAHSAFVTVMHGCSNYCSYCIVPFVRGHEVSRQTGDILTEIETLVARGIREVTLLGQNVNSYRDPATGLDFAGLLYRVAAMQGLDRVRFVTSHPRDFTPPLARTFARIPTLMPYLHLPAQSGSDRILGLMERGYTVDEYLARLETVRSFCPDISLSSDFIVGFPGETEEDFAGTLDLVRRARYDTLFAFVYSARPGTKAASFPETLSPDKKLDRLHRLLTTQRALMASIRDRFVGRVVRVLIEEESPSGGTMMGRSEHNQIVHVVGSGKSDLGRIVAVSVKDRLENTLRGIRVGSVS